MPIQVVVFPKWYAEGEKNLENGKSKISPYGSVE